MDPNTGTFLSVDPVVPQYDDPQSLNAYAYARNNPVSYSDPTGMSPIELPGYYWVNSHVSADGTTVTNVYTNSAAAAGAAWLGPFEMPSLPTSATSGGGGFGGVGSVSMGDLGGASLAGIGALGGAAPSSQPVTTPSSPVPSTPTTPVANVGITKDGSSDLVTDPSETSGGQRGRNSDTANGELLRLATPASSTGMKVRGVGFMASGAASMGAGGYLMATGATAATVSGPGLLVLGGGLIVMGGIDWMLGTELAGQGQ